ncbi:hypothetical protein AUJ46_02250 [Candidatus Peregrinibacteria bacterium CG1_02_54_53]|nr:MAG: hypothetical protein AUJ46_02250 [Candidatus Peregrinibacteria bacterium CG1_02_54_53]
MFALGSTGWNSGFLFFLMLHMAAMVALGVGIAFLLFWSFKHLSKQALWTWGWVLVAVGIVFCLLTIPMVVSGMFGFGGRTFGSYNGTVPMMFGATAQNTSAQAKPSSDEEAQGKAIYDKLQAKQVACADLSDDDFDLLGDYFMGLRTGASHEQMDTFMLQMMGEEADKQMHIIMGRRLSGCSAGGESLRFPQGMMGGGYGGMMGGYAR